MVRAFLRPRLGCHGALPKQNGTHVISPFSLGGFAYTELSAIRKVETFSQRGTAIEKTGTQTLSKKQFMMPVILGLRPAIGKHSRLKGTQLRSAYLACPLSQVMACFSFGHGRGSNYATGSEERFAMESKQRLGSE